MAKPQFKSKLCKIKFGKKFQKCALTKKYVCRIGSCKYTTSNLTHFQNHEMTHSKIKPFSCQLCEYTSSQEGNIKRHMRIHTGEKPFSCECGFTCSTSSYLKLHKRKHTGEKPYSCDFKCGYKCSQLSSIISHHRIHTGEKPYSCDFQDCEYKSSKQSGLIVHKRTHTGEKPYSCDFKCGYKCSQLSSIIYHHRTHTGEKPYSCDFEGCGYKSATGGCLKDHKKTHTIHGQIRHKKQEKRVNKILKDWGYVADCEVTINSLRTNCVPDTQRFFSRLDFTIFNCVKAILILEVDEDQHYWYNLSCEFSRMSDVRASLMKAGYELPIYWIRYNPNGKRIVYGKENTIGRSRREVELKKHLELVCSPTFVPKNEVNIHYMYYDLISKDNGPEILEDPDFPEALRPCVTWC